MSFSIQINVFLYKKSTLKSINKSSSSIVFQHSCRYTLNCFSLVPAYRNPTKNRSKFPKIRRLNFGNPTSNTNTNSNLARLLPIGSRLMGPIQSLLSAAKISTPIWHSITHKFSQFSSLITKLIS